MERTGLEQWKAREVARLLSLVETERRYYQEMVAALPVGMAVLGRDRAIQSTNKAFRQIFKLRNEELRGRTLEQILPSDYLIEKIHTAHVHGEVEPFFLDAGEHTFRLALAPMRSWEDGEPETLVMIEDMGEIDRQRGGARSLASESLPAILWRAEAATLQFKTVGGAAEEFTGHAPAHWMGNPKFFWERIHPEDVAQVKALYEPVIQSGGEATAEFRSVTREGETVWLRESIRTSVVKGALVIDGVITHISRRKQLEAQLLTAGRVDAIQHLAARLAHDLNNPLMIINGYGEDLLGNLPQTDERRADVEEILSAGRRLSELANQLLAFARKTTETPVRVNLTRAIQDLNAALKQANRAPIERREIPEGSTLVGMGNPDQILGVLATIASAALESTKNARVLNVTSQTDVIQEHIGPATLGAGSYARVDFHATGEGLIETANPGAAFEAVLAAKDPAAPSPALARAYALVREWGGDIAASGDARGAMFALYLPAASATPEMLAPVAEAVPVKPEPEPEPPKDTILLVDDEAGIRGLVRRILQREHYQVIEAANGKEALAVAAGHAGPIQMLLTDVNMPEMNGMDLAKSMETQYPGIRVVFVSGQADPSELGAFPGAAFLRKPFTLTELLRVVRGALEKKA